MSTTSTLRKSRRAGVEPEEFLAKRNSGAYELVDGCLVRRPMGAESSWVATRIICILGAFLEGKKLGLLFTSEASYQCFPDAPKKLRRADVSFVRRDRFPDDIVPKAQLKVPPDLAVEVVSPGDNAEELEKKVGEYLSAGARLVWVVYPTGRRVVIRRPATAAAGRIAELLAQDTITGEDVIPGFACPVSRFFERT
jgi:Uma2 family endonuclease